MTRPEDEDEEVEDFEPVEEVDEEFESVEEEAKPEEVEEFESFDEDAPDEIDSSGFKTKGGEIPGYEPTVDEVLSYAMGKTKDPSEPTEPREPGPVDTKVGDSLVSLLSKTHAPEAEGDAGEGEDEEGDEEEDGSEENDDLQDIFDDEEKME